MKAKSKNEVPVGAVVFNEKRILSKAHNLTIKNKDPLAHAEILALRKAAKKLKTINLNNYNIYVTLEPCIYCRFAISKYLISSIYFGLYDDNKLGIKKRISFFNENFKGHNPDIYGGIGEEEISYIMKSFFKKLREKN